MHGTASSRPHLQIYYRLDAQRHKAERAHFQTKTFVTKLFHAVAIDQSTYQTVGLTQIVLNWHWLFWDSHTNGLSGNESDVHEG
jgi:hypothetical protein